jgi:hypothetical protein
LLKFQFYLIKYTKLARDHHLHYLFELKFHSNQFYINYPFLFNKNQKLQTIFPCPKRTTYNVTSKDIGIKLEKLINQLPHVHTVSKI